jgi:hypothetical protein
LEYWMNELSLVLPGGTWHDATVHRLDVPTSGGHRILVEVTRAEPIFGERLRQHVDAELKAHARGIRGFELIGREAFEVAEVTGISASFRAVATEGGVHHEVAYLPLESALLTFAVTAPAPQAAACREVIVSAIESIRLRPAVAR